MKRCFYFLMFAFILGGFQDAWGEPNDQYGIVQGKVTSPPGGILPNTRVTAVVDTVVAEDYTDNDGLYTLFINLTIEGSDSLIVDIHAERDGYNPHTYPDIEVRFLEIDIVDFILSYEYGPIQGFVSGLNSNEDIGGVTVLVVGDSSKSTTTDTDGSYSLTVRDSSPPNGYDISFSHGEYLDTTVNVIVAIGRHPLNMILDRVNWYVAMDGNDYSGIGSFDFPFATIQTAVDSTSDNDTVYVFSGIMRGQANGNVNVSLTDKKIIVSSIAGPDSTTIDCEGDSSSNESRRAFIIQNDRGSKIKGFTIKNGFSVADGGAINCSQGGSTFIEDCVFIDNYSGSSGGAVASQLNYTEARITNCVFYNNAAGELGGGIYAFNTGRVILNDCTLTKNEADSGGGISIFASDYDSLTNCIIWGNSPTQIDTSFIITTIEVSHCVIEDAEEGGWEGEFIFDQNPFFCDAYENDFHIAANSFCCGNGAVGDTIGALGVGCDSAGVIFGTVTKLEDGLPLEGVTVTAESSRLTVRQDETDSDGEYEIVIPDAIEGDYANVNFSKPLYTPVDTVDFPFNVGLFAQLDIVMVRSICGNYVIGDFNGSGVFNIADVIAAFSKLKTGDPEPGMVCECVLGSGILWAVAMDVNNSCEFNIADVINAYAALQPEGYELVPCDVCPPSG